MADVGQTANSSLTMSRMMGHSPAVVLLTGDFAYAGVMKCGSSSPRTTEPLLSTANCQLPTVADGYSATDPDLETGQGTNGARWKKCG